MARNSSDYPADFVVKVNEVFHDVEGADYAQVHPEIYRGEAERWDCTARRQLAARQRPLRILDFGCGAGFVAQRIIPLLTNMDTLVCADLSHNMLQACRAALGTCACRLEFAKLDGRSIPMDEQSCDIVTMNSVLHHLPDVGAVLREIDRILRPGGCLIVAHEPNRRFYASRAMRLRAAVLGMVLSPRQAIGAVLRRLRVMHLINRYRGGGHAARVLAEVSRRLMLDSIIAHPLTQDELTAIVDIGSPTAGGWHPQRGIDMQSLARRFLPNYHCEITTYDHLGSGTDARMTGWLARYARQIARRRPADGATLLAILTKPTTRTPGI